MFSLILLNLTFEEIVTDIPHDAAAVVVYLLLALFVGFIWYGSRPGAAGEEDAGRSTTAHHG
ncbi:hypothetical protein BH23GEM7_BH23GEM7_24470 [soil metagenome]|jgi:hypothetical protein